MLSIHPRLQGEALLHLADPKANTAWGGGALRTPRGGPTGAGGSSGGSGLCSLLLAVLPVCFGDC